MIAKRRLHQIVSFFVALTMVLQMLGVPLAPQATASVIGETGMDAALETSSEHVAAATTAASATTGPDVLDNPLSVSRVQSTYQTGANVTITYTVNNNQVATHVPALGSATTVTESADILTGFVITDDMNTLREVSLATTLANGATYVDSTRPPVQNGDTFTWELADIPPGATAVLTLTLQSPPAAPDFIELDGGATVDAALWDTAVSHQARPILLAPDTIDPATLAATPDADPYDQDMLWQTAAFTQDPLGIFQYVQSMRYDPYAGSLRGTRGTLWGAAGNSLDQSSLLIAALRAAGIPARYRHGTLSTADAQTLLASAFPTTRGAAGYLPDGAETADPLNDPALIALAQNHWWAEAYLPGQGWTDLDPSFPGATVGQAVAVPASDGSDQISEAPGAVRHTVTLSLVIEQYTQFPVDGTFLQESVPLSATLPTAQVAGRRVILRQFVEDNVPAGAVFATREIVYQPYFGIPETGQAFLGDAFQDILSNFPFSTRATTAVWLQYQITDPVGESESFQRPIKDLIGPDVRLNGGEPDLAFDSTSPPFLTPDEQYVNWVLPNDVPEWAYRHRVISALPTTLQLGRRMEETLAFLDVPTGTELTAEQLNDLVGAAGAALSANTESLILTGLNFATKADRAVDAIESGLHTRLFYSSPRLFAVGTTLPISGSAEATVDLRTTRATALVAPGQSAWAGQTAQWLKGIVESELEGAVLEDVYDTPAVTTANVFARMESAGAEPVLIQPDQIHLLDLYSFSSQGKAHMLDALLAGKWVLAPEQPIAINGEDAFAWWEFDPSTGETIGVGEDGLHTAAINWRIVEMLVEEVVTQLLEFLFGFFLDKFSGGTVSTNPSPSALTQMAEMLEEIGNSLNELFLGIADVLSESAMYAPQQISEISEASSGWAYLPAHLCPVDNCGVEQFFLDTAAAQPISLPEMTFAYGDGPPSDPVDVAAWNVTATLPPGDPTLALVAAPASSATAPGASVSFQADIATNIDDTFTTIAYAPDDWVVTVDAGGTVNAQPPLTAVASDHAILIVTQSQSHPDMVASAIHTVSVAPTTDLSVSATAEPNLTVSLGNAAFAAVSNQTNDGEAEIPDAAWRLTVTNFSSQAETITIDVSGAPAGWTILNGARQERTTFALDANTQAQIGLYLLPPHVPAPGTSFDLTVEVDNGNGATESVILPWSMPGQAHNYLQVIPETLYAEIGGSVDFDLFMANVGSAAGTFPISVTSPLTANVSNLQSTMSLEPDESDTQTPTLTVADGEVGRRYPLLFASTAPDSYTQYALAELRLVSANTGAVFSAADSACTQDEPGLSPALETLAIAMTNLENACADGDCPPVLRDQVVGALESVANYADSASSLVTADDTLRSIAGDLAAHSDDGAIEAELAAIGPAVSEMEEQVCELSEHRVRVAWTPAYEAALSGQSVTYTLGVENQGTVTTTYAITLDLPSGQTTFEEVIAAGATEYYEVAIAEEDRDLYTLAAAAAAIGPAVSLAGIGDEAEAHLNVVDRFVRVTGVTADPAFVETGGSSTTLGVDVANVANVVQSTTARTEIIAPDGDVRYSADLPLTVLGGASRSYELAAVDTSGWTAGVYTITVNLLGANDELIADGHGYGYFSVGQGVVASHRVTPALVAPGAVTVTTAITTESNSLVGEVESETVSEATSTTIYNAPGGNGGVASSGDGEADGEMDEPLTFDNAHLPAPDEDASTDEERAEASDDEAPPADDEGAETASTVEVDEVDLPAPQSHIVIEDAFVRTEQDEAEIVYTGTWSEHTFNRASGGSYWRNATAGSTAELTFDGSWFNVGFIGDRFSGHAEIFVDGESQGVVDLYRREGEPVSFFYDGLIDATHTISVTVLGSSNPFASSSRVQLDYVDFGDDAALSDGVFEQDSERVILSNGWTTVNDANASGGSYVRGSAATAWFPFTGDSFSYQAMAYNLGGKARLYVDGRYLDTVDLYNASAITRTFAYEGFGPGAHVLQIGSYRGNTTVDALTTPGTEPFVDPNPPVTGVTRYEEDHPAIRYNGVPFTQTAQSWTRENNIFSTRASDGQYIYSAAAGDSVSLNFEGDWVGVGFATRRFSGRAEIAIDGEVMTEADLYTRFDDTESFYFNDLGPGEHTITVTVLGTRHDNATDSRVYVDYFDVWDGEPLAEGVFEETDERLFTSSGWSRTVNGDASGGGYANSGTSNATAWFPFTGDSVTAQVWTAKAYQSVELKVDGVSQGLFNVSQLDGGPRSFSFDGLGGGAHVLEVRKYRGNATFDAFVTPSTGEHYDPPEPAGVIRLEEDHPDLRYDGYPFRQMPQSWNTQSTLNSTSGGYNATTDTAGNTLSTEFEGPWVGVGFRSTSGMAEIFIDGVSRGQYDTSGGAGGVNSVYFDDLGDGSHTISVTVASGTVRPDFIDIWDGQPPGDGWYDADLDDGARFHFSDKGWWGQHNNQYAHDGDFLTQSLVNANPNMWFTFVGNDLTVLSFNRAGSILDIAIDGESYGEFDLTAEYSNQPFALHFPDLGEGPHTVRIATRDWGRVDAFEVNPDGFYSYTPQVTWHDDAAKEELDPDYGTGFLSSVALGDLDGDGSVELVAPARNGRLYVYRGDGADVGEGTPILWTSDLVGPAAEPGLADLTGDGTAEIVVTGYNGAFAFRHDGTLLWQEPAIQSTYSDDGGIYGWGGPTIGNLDDDLYPEIVIAASEDAIYVLDHEGNVLDSEPTGLRPTVPILADVTGDGALNIVVAQDHTLTVYDYDNLGGLAVAWSYTLAETTTRSGAYGAPAVADLTGDGTPEIIINWGHRIEALQADGQRLWSYDTGDDSLYFPSPVTVADATGDGRMNLITASAVNAGFHIFNHNLMVLNADGALVWEQLVADGTASASGVAAQDLTGDGVWEIMWNGSEDGFLIIRGSDGKRLFNEPFTASGTIIDYPALGDVDGDGVADVVLAGREGIFVLSHVGRWIDSRPMWNQHNYHVTNINDDWSVPFAEPNSWEAHNTYRTQTPERNPAPSYRVEVTHTVGISGVSVLTETFSTSAVEAPPSYYWEYQLDQYAPAHTITFDSELAAMQPGETRAINQGTEIGYRLPSGWNWLTLPPLYVSAPHIVSVEPVSQTVGVGGTATYTVTLSNPAAVDEIYALTVAGLPDGWASTPATVSVAAGSNTAVPLSVTPPPGATPGEWAFVVSARNESGGIDQAGASLAVIDALDISVSPSEQAAAAGETVTYTLTVSNHESVARTYALTASGLANVALPASITVPANGSQSLAIQVTASQAGPHPFTVHASSDRGTASADGLLEAGGSRRVGLALDPEPAIAGPGTTAVLTMTVTNLGDVADSYDLSVDLPAGWSYALDANGANVGSVTVPPHVFNSANLDLAVTPDTGALPGSYTITATARSQAQPAMATTITGTVEVLERGVQVTVDPAVANLHPADTGLWQVTITNTGDVADSYWLTATGIVGLSGEFSTNPVSLNPGQVATVQLTADGLDFALSTPYPFAVAATSQDDGRIHAEATAAVAFEEAEAVAVAWQPAGQTITDTYSAVFLLVVTNTGNVNTTFQLGVDAPGLSGDLPLGELALPARATAMLPLSVEAAAPGTYTVEGTVTAGTSGDAALATLTVIATNEAPTADAGPDQTVDEGETVSFAGSTGDPEDGALTVRWDFGDGVSATDTLSPSHAYADDGEYVVTLTVTDETGLSASDTLVVNVENVAPSVDAGADQTTEAGVAVQFSGSFTDPGALDTHTIAWGFGDGQTASGTLAPAHVYEEAGVYTVTLTVTDDDGGEGSDEVTVTVMAGERKLFMPVISRP